MADNPISNVVPFGGRESSLTTAMLDDAVAMLGVCRDRLIDGVSAVFTRHLGRANDELLAMADRATSHSRQQSYFAATQFLSNRGPQLLQQFRTCFVGCFDATLNGLTTSSQPQRLELPDELTLVDDKDFEQDLAITKLTTRAAFNCSQQLVPLDRRMVALLRLQGVTQESNPLYPGRLYAGMLRALGQMGLESDAALEVLQAFERHTAPELPRLYAEINRYLAESGILPTMSLKSAHEAALQGGAARSNLAGATLYPGTGLGQAGPLGYPGGTGQDVFSQLMSALQSMAGMSGGAPGWSGGAPQMPQMMSLGGPTPPSLSRAQLVQALGTLQHGSVDPSHLPGLGAIQIDPYGGNALQQLRATPMAQWSHPMDAMTMDIVAMLFDAMFNDPDLPASLRAEIAKLQIPVLKVALLDKGFFSDRKHPARRLLDAIANSGIGRGHQDEPRLAAKIREIVEQVVQGFDSDVQVFDAQADELAQFLADEERMAQSKATQMVDQLEAGERAEMAPSRAAAEIERRARQPGVPVLIADFLRRSWRLVLADCFARVGEAGAEWQESLRLMDELIWSVAAKTSSQERERLVMMLPEQLKRLRGGLERIGAAGVWDGFFKELIQLHVSALHKDLPTELYPQGPRTSRGEGTLRESGRTWDSQTLSDSYFGPDTETSLSVPSKDVEEPTSDQYLTLVQRLEVGAWVELQSERGTRNTLRLSWVSDLRRVLLFTNRQGENAMTLAATSLADHLRKGTARLLSQNPLTDRAVAQVLERFKPAGSAPETESRPRGYAWE